MGRVTISEDDPRAGDVRALVSRHLAFANEHSPPEDVHALDLGGLADEDVTFFTLRSDGALLGMGALRELDPAHGELKSMHTAAEARGGGLGEAMLRHLLDVARRRGYRRVSLETGSMEAFAPARRLYARAGFTVCEPFGDYRPSRNSTFMTLAIEPVPARIASGFGRVHGARSRTKRGGRPEVTMSDYGENYSMCINDEQREAYRIGWNDAKADPNSEHPEHVGMLWREFYQFGFLDGSGGG